MQKANVIFHFKLWIFRYSYNFQFTSFGYQKQMKIFWAFYYLHKANIKVGNINFRDIMLIKLDSWELNFGIQSINSIINCSIQQIFCFKSSKNTKWTSPTLIFSEVAHKKLSNLIKNRFSHRFLFLRINMKCKNRKIEQLNDTSVDWNSYW